MSHIHIDSMATQYSDMDNHTLLNVCNQLLEQKAYGTLANLIQTNKRFYTVCKHLLVRPMCSLILAYSGGGGNASYPIAYVDLDGLRDFIETSFRNHEQKGIYVYVLYPKRSFRYTRGDILINLSTGGGGGGGGDGRRLLTVENRGTVLMVDFDNATDWKRLTTVIDRICAEGLN
jgi:hypothetical protein